MPLWVAYHLVPAYRQTLPRKNEFVKYRTDRDVSNPVRDSEYKGIFTSREFARGHLAPYAVMGGDRDGNGKSASDGAVATG